jgi:hypothetical protein
MHVLLMLFGFLSGNSTLGVLHCLVEVRFFELHLLYNISIL